MFRIHPEASGFGAAVTGIKLDQEISQGDIGRVRAAWLKHQVLYFPEQAMSVTDLERFTVCLGTFGDEPYIKAMEGHEHVIELRREPDEKAPPFGNGWHSDWSFQEKPPSGTILHSKIVPPVGGDTWYADGCAAYEALDNQTRKLADGLTALHSARDIYSNHGLFANENKARNMTILLSDKALSVQEHPMVRTHPETNKRVLWVNAGYTVGIKAMKEDESRVLLARLFKHTTRDEFVYKHRWKPNMLIIWDNRSVQHFAQGGYDGHRRVMHRTTVAGDKPR